MKLGRYEVGMPVYRLISQVTYQSVRMPTVFERMVLRLVARYRDIPDVATLPLGKLFEERLGIQDALALVNACIRNLQALEVLDWPQSQEPLALPVGSFWLTSTGQDFQRRDRLPVNPRTTEVQHDYFPLEGTVLPVQEKNRPLQRLSERPVPLHLGEDVLRPAGNLAATLVTKGLPGEKYDWKSPTTEIREVHSQVVNVFWETHILELSCDEAGVLSVSAPASPRLRQWLANANREVVWEHLLSPVFTRVDAAGAVSLKGLSAGKATKVLPAGVVARIAEPADKEPASMLRIVPASAGPIPAFPGPMLLLQPDADIVRLADVSGALRVMAPEPDSMPDGFAGLSLSRQTSQPAVDVSGLLPMFWAGQPRECMVRLTLGSDKSREVWEMVSSALEQSFARQPDPVLKVLPVLWQPPARMIEVLGQSLAGKQFGDVMTSAGGLGDALKTVAAATRQAWEPVWHDCLERQLTDALEKLPSDQHPQGLMPWLDGVRKLLPPMAAAKLQSGLLAHAAQLESMKDLADVRARLVSSVRVPDTLIADSIFQAGVRQVLSGATTHAADIPEAGVALTQLGEAAAAVRRDIGEPALAAATEGRFEWRGISSRSLDSVRRWRDVRKTLEAFRPRAALTRIDAYAVIDQGVETWSRLVHERLAPACAPSQRLVVIDTSALMARPDLLQHMPSRDLPVLPRKVLEELDSLKQGGEDDDRAKAARQAVRSIEARKDLRFESADPGLLPAEWEHSADNLILSVALRLRLSDVLLLSADKNLRNKAKAEQINAQGVEEYSGGRPATKSKPKNHPRRK